MLQSKEIRNKIQNTFKEKYGYITPAKNNNVKEKRINTCNKKYGGNPGYLAGTPESLNKQITTLQSEKEKLQGDLDITNNSISQLNLEVSSLNNTISYCLFLDLMIFP